MQGVGVEEAAPVRGGRGRHHVVERALDEVGVRRVAVIEKQPPREHHRGDPRTGLGVGAVRRQLPVDAERLVLVVRALTARDVRPAAARPPPLTAEGVEQRVVAAVDGDIHGTRGEVVGPHRVAAERLGVAHRHVVLEVGATPLDVAERLVTAARDEQRRLPAVARFAGEAGELGQSGLDLGVAAEGRDAVGPEDVAHEVGGAAGDRQQPVVGARSCPLAGHGGLEQMPEAVQLVPPFQVGPAGLLAGAAELGVQVPVVLLRGGHAGDDGAERALQVGIVGAADLPRGGLEELVDLGVRELAPAAPLRQAARGGQVEVRQPSLGFEPVEDVGEGVGGVHALALTPEPAGDADLAQSEGTQGGAGRDDGGDHGGRRGDVEGTGGEGGGHGHPLKAPDMKPRT